MPAKKIVSKVNANVSSSALSTAEREQISDFAVIASEEENKFKFSLFYSKKSM